eukprot:gnl/TRDRNA2_/TRDRNA2_129596_c0_seq1.p1 gnl/TRDRNA2_/TRDRNA2_129596_c0~~gnl/TRDRNA2_/TRDRNA2_129596_c0_seq1.p1  ORF type:complete len:251 (-),score=22.74 gnl/TRDRNA2_/TRDRNA2_129596_c0_seq1:49-801(-)
MVRLLTTLARAATLAREISLENSKVPVTGVHWKFNVSDATISPDSDFVSWGEALQAIQEPRGGSKFFDTLVRAFHSDEGFDRIDPSTPGKWKVWHSGLPGSHGVPADTDMNAYQEFHNAIDPMIHAGFCHKVLKNHCLKCSPARPHRSADLSDVEKAQYRHIGSYLRATEGIAMQQKRAMIQGESSDATPPNTEGSGTPFLHLRTGMQSGKKKAKMLFERLERHDQLFDKTIKLDDKVWVIPVKLPSAVI